MLRTYRFIIEETVEDPRAAMDDRTDEELGYDEDAAVNTARANVIARYGSLAEAISSADVEEVLD